MRRFDDVGVPVELVDVLKTEWRMEMEKIERRREWDRETERIKQRHKEMHTMESDRLHEANGRLREASERSLQECPRSVTKERLRLCWEHVSQIRGLLPQVRARLVRARAKASVRVAAGSRVRVRGWGMG